MSVETKESFWREHQESLKRIRNHLVSGRKSAGKTRSPIHGKKTPGGQRSPAVRSHPPLGKYRRTPPPYLPRLNTPPEHDRLKENKNLRKVRYEVVPPVKPKTAFVNTPDYDSWGEESDDEKDQEEEQHFPHPYPYPYPYYAPAPVVFGQPFPGYYPPPPKGASRNQRRKDGKRGKSQEKSYRDLHKDRQQYYSYPAAKKNLKGKHRNSSRHAVPGQRGYPMPVLTGYPGNLQNSYPIPMLNTYVIPMQNPSQIVEDRGVDFEDSRPKYKYIYPRDDDNNADDYEDEGYDDLNKAVLLHFVNHPLFADDVASWFINECLEEELIPDLLIDTLTEVDRLPPEEPYYIPALHVCEEFLGKEIEKMVRDVIKDTITDMVDEYLGSHLFNRDPLEDWLTALVDESVRECCEELVKESVRDLADDYIENQIALSIMGDLVSDHVQEIGIDLFEDSKFELIAEDFIAREVIAPEVADEAEDVAKEMIKYYDNKMIKRELKSIRTQAGERLVDSLCLEYLLSLISRQGKVWTESDFANRYLDDMMVNILIEQYIGVRKQRDKTVQCKPLRKLHEKVVTDVALDVLLQQLSASLDEDLADVDEYERGVNDGLVQSIPTAVR